MAIIRQLRRGKSGQGQYGEYGFEAKTKSNSLEQGSVACGVLNVVLKMPMRLSSVLTVGQS